MSTAKALVMAQGQVKQAMFGNWLQDYRHAEGGTTLPNTVLQGPSTLLDAKVLGAYWMAVAARLLEDRSLALKAQAQLGEVASVGAGYAAVLDPQKVAASITEAANAIQLEASKNQADSSEDEVGKIKGVLGILGTWNAAFVQNSQDNSLVRQTINMQLSTWDKIQMFLAGVFWKGERPSYISKVAWPFLKWGTRIFVGSMVLGVVGFALRPYLAPLKAVYNRLVGIKNQGSDLLSNTGKVIADLEGFKLTELNPNPRKSLTRRRK